MRAIGTFFLLGILIATPAIAQEDPFCTRIANTARTIMQHRQDGGAPGALTGADPTDVLVQSMISSAYKVPMMDTQTRRERAIQDFADTQTQALSCYRPLDIPTD